MLSCLKRATQVIVVLGVIEYCCCARPNGIVMLIPRVLTQKHIYFLLGTSYSRTRSVIKSTMSVVAIIAFAVAVRKYKQEHTHTHTHHEQHRQSEGGCEYGY